MTFVAKAKWGLLFVVCTMMYGCYGPLLLLSQVDGRLQYDPSQVVWLTELVKLIVSITLLSNQSILKRFSFREALPYFVPALCYFVNANICPRLMDHLDPATFSALSNIKVVITTLLYIIIMKRYPNSLQITALAILTAASAIHSYGLSVTGGKADVSYHKGEPMEMRASVYGVVLLLCGVSLTSFASVYTEYIMKRGYAVSLHKQSMYLYSSGVSFNTLAVLWKMQDGRQSINSTNSFSLFQGFNIYSWTIVFTTALQGFCVSVIMKHSSNITKLVLTCVSIMVSTLMSMALFDLQITLYFVISLSFILIGLPLYMLGS